MIKATATASNGRKLLLLGLSFANLDRFRAEPGDTMIRIEGKELDLPVDVLVFSAETEAQLAELISELIGPATRVHISNRLKS